jgi:hypothetical protein
MIVDDADMEMEMAKDPFLEAGIAIPAELPYKDDKQRESSARDVVGHDDTADNKIYGKIRKMSNALVLPTRRGSERQRKRLDSTVSAYDGSLRSEFATIQETSKRC